MLSGLTQSLQAKWKRVNLAGTGAPAIRIALLFGCVTAALTLIMSPEAARRGHQAVFDPGIDLLVTSAIRSRNDSHVGRGNVLQRAPDSVCIISRDGSKRGQC